MLRIWMLTLTVCSLLLTNATADVYRCRMPDGRIVMTDQEAEMPADCQPFDGPAGEGSFNVMPATKEAVASPPAERETTGIVTEVPNTPALQDQAAGLVQNYEEAVKKRYHASQAADQRRAMVEIAKLKEQKQQMLEDLTGSGLKRDDQDVIRKLLDQIPED